jgi:hypothetical protein
VVDLAAIASLVQAGGVVGFAALVYVELRSFRKELRDALQAFLKAPRRRSTRRAVGGPPPRASA